MKIGIATPSIAVSSLSAYFNNLSDFELKLGLGVPAVSILIDGLLKQGHQVIVFTLDAKVKKQHILEGENLKIIFGRNRRYGKIKMLDFWWREWLQVYRFIKKEAKNLDIINAHWSYEFAIGALLAAPEKTIVTFRDDAPTILRLYKQPFRITRLLMDKWVRKKVQYITYNSAYLGQIIKMKGQVIPNPFFKNKNATFKNHLGPPHTFKICFLANGTGPRKNPHVAIQAFQKVQNKLANVELYFFGRGYEPNSKFAKLYENINNIFFKGFIPHNSLLDSLPRYDIMLHTSLEESFGNNLIEAMSVGMPVVAGKNSGAVPWVLDWGKAGFLVDITSPDDIAQALEQLILNKELYEQYSKAGLNNVMNRFTQEVVCQKYVVQYQKVINNYS